MPVAPIPESSVVLRREYLKVAREVAIMQPTEESAARLIALTQALLRDVTGEPSLFLTVSVSQEALNRNQAKEGEP